MRKVLPIVVMLILFSIGSVAYAQQFEIEDLSYRNSNYGNMELIGTLINNSDTGYKAITFNLAILDFEDETLIDVIPMSFLDVSPREKKSFKCYLKKKLPEKFKYRLDLNFKVEK
jgi:hypothetical protein